jgi:hypothetical protein
MCCWLILIVRAQCRSQVLSSRSRRCGACCLPGLSAACLLSSVVAGEGGLTELLSLAR